MDNEMKNVQIFKFWHTLTLHLEQILWQLHFPTFENNTVILLNDAFVPFWRIKFAGWEDDTPE